MLEKGFLIYALGHPFYGRYAWNLAVTIHAMERVPVVMVADLSGIGHLEADQLAIFEEVIMVEGEKPSCSVKLSAYKRSPFKKTIVLDADMLWLPERLPCEMFAELEGADFTAICEGSSDAPSGAYFFWADLEDIRAKYNVSKVHQWRTEVMYFEKGPVAEKFFNDAISIYFNHGLSDVKEFAGGIPDELAVNVSAAVNEIEPKNQSWAPSYWPQINGHRIPELGSLYRNYYLLSVGGNVTAENVKQLYNRIVKAQAPKIGLSHVFPAQSKMSFLPERRKS